jgi:putative transcription factor
MNKMSLYFKMSNFQDWKTVTIGKNKGASNGGSVLPVSIQRNIDSNSGKIPVSNKKYKEDEFGIPVKNGLKKGFGTRMAQARTAKGLTQKDLASRIGEKVQVVKDYESEKVINVNQGIIRKMEKYIGPLSG